MMRTRPAISGSIYLPVLLVSLVAATLAVGGLMSLRSLGRAAAMRADSNAARTLATSAVEIGRSIIAADPEWRKNRNAGTWLNAVPVGAGKLTLTVTSPAGNLDRNPSDPVILTGIGTFGRSTQRVTALLAPAGDLPISALRGALSSDERVEFSVATAGPSGRLIASNGNIEVSGLGTLISADASAKGDVKGILYTGSVQTDVAEMEFPENDYLASYLSDATTISVTSLPLVSGSRRITEVVLSPAANPFGPTNSRGIYLIDCNNQPLVIESSRLAATLIIVDSPLVTVSGQVNWELADSALPALIVEGKLALRMEASNSLREADLGPLVDAEQTALEKLLGLPVVKVRAGLNLNPVASPFPFPGGSSDTDVVDSYTTRIGGLIYATDDTTLSGNNTLHTLVAKRKIIVTGNVNLDWDRRYLLKPPPGFESKSAGRMTVTIR
jgi:hypothetical protein